MVKIGLIGEYDASITAHRAIPQAIALAGDALKISTAIDWVATDEIPDAARISGFDALWCVPGSPYRCLDGALLAIRFARESGLPFLGTCGGFQHVVIEYARDVFGWADAEHAETAPDAARPVISLLECGLVEATETITLKAGTHIRKAHGCSDIAVTYRCRYGLNPSFVTELTSGHLKVAAVDRAGEVRALELDHHPFFVATLFQPERAALAGICPPLAAALVEACVRLPHT